MFVNPLTIWGSAKSFVRMNSNVLIQRGSVYTILLAIVILFFLGTVFSVGYLSKDADDQSDVLGAGVTTLIGIFAIPHLERYFRKATDKIFFKDKYDYSLAMYSLSEVLNKNIDLDELLHKLEASLRAIFKANDARIVLMPSKNASRPGKEGIYIPISFETRVLGAVSLGRKLSGDPYTSEDVTFLRTFSHQAAIAIEKAKLYKEVLDRSNALEEKVKERTAEIESLRESERQTMLDISHGLQTPLTIVKGQLELFKNQRPSGDRLDILESSIDKASKSIDDILKLARLESNRECSAREFVDLSALLEDILEYVSVIIEEKHIELNAVIEPDIGILCSKYEIEELFTNLISNAIKYTEASHRRTVTAILKKSAGMAEFTIQDTGVGIDEGDLPHIFERFYGTKHRLPNARSTGLGLAIAKSIVKNHGGTIGAQSTLGAGATFTVSLPLPEE